MFNRVFKLALLPSLLCACNLDAHLLEHGSHTVEPHETIGTVTTDQLTVSANQTEIVLAPELERDAYASFETFSDLLKTPLEFSNIPYLAAIARLDDTSNAVNASVVAFSNSAVFPLYTWESESHAAQPICQSGYFPVAVNQGSSVRVSYQSIQSKDVASCMNAVTKALNILTGTFALIEAIADESRVGQYLSLQLNKNVQDKLHELKSLEMAGKAPTTVSFSLDPNWSAFIQTRSRFHRDLSVYLQINTKTHQLTLDTSHKTELLRILSEYSTEFGKLNATGRAPAQLSSFSDVVVTQVQQLQKLSDYLDLQ